MKKAVITALGLAAFSLSAMADVAVKDAWVRGTTPAQKATGAFMEITSSDAAALLSAASPAAGVVEIHTMKMEDGVMKMRQIPKLDLPAGKGIKLQPGGNHVMLMDLKQQLKKGDVVPITLKIEGKDKQVQTLEIKAEVRDLAAPATMDHGHKH
ncbi:MAG: copper chaperone PCu(A)C [Rhodocyclaceae bacterium]|jgi:copper(I)-binding protein|nr:copper chaperone PCu(A)C [Rhodocyclaceae bacterium]